MMKVTLKESFKKYAITLTIFAFAFALSLSFISPSSWALQTQASYGTTQDKKCEKCERGDDGKMVCKPVPCP